MAGGRQRIWAVILGALILASLGATAGSWYGGRNPAPLPSDAQAVALAAELLPGVTPAGGTDRRDYSYGYALGDDDFGPGYVEISYAPFRENLDGASVDCALSEPARVNATAQGWRHLRSLEGYPCESWFAERGPLAATFTTDLGGPVLTFYRAAPPGMGQATLAGALLGAIAGAVAVWLLHRRPRPLLLLTAGVVALPVLPVTAMASLATALDLFDGPVLPFWTIWPTLGYPLAALSIILAVLGTLGWLTHRGRTS